MSKELYIYMSKELCTSVKRAPSICQKRSINMSKELYIYMSKELCKLSKELHLYVKIAL